MLRSLSARKWVSMSLERILGISPESPLTFLQSDAVVSPNFDNELDMGPERFKYFLEYVNGPEEVGISQRPTTAFEAEMPGAMTKEEVDNEIDLGQWRMMIHGRIVRLKVNVCIL